MAARKKPKQKPRPRQAPGAGAFGWVDGLFAEVFGQNSASTSSAWWGFAQAAAQTASAGANAVIREITEWGSHLARNAVVAWAPVLASGVRCSAWHEGRYCGGAAVSGCDACGTHVCLAHGRLDYEGQIICFQCVEKVKVIARREGWKPETAPPPVDAPPGKRWISDQEAARALRSLGLSPDASFDEVKKRYRQLAFENSPDRPDSKVPVAEREGFMKRANAAFALLGEYYQQQATREVA